MKAIISRLLVSSETFLTALKHSLTFHIVMTLTVVEVYCLSLYSEIADWKYDTKNITLDHLVECLIIKWQLCGEGTLFWVIVSCYTSKIMISPHWRNLKVHYCIHESPPSVPIVSHINRVHTLPLCSFRIFFHFNLRFKTKRFMYFVMSPMHTAKQTHILSPWFSLPNNIW